MKQTLLVYTCRLNEIGGVESFIVNFCKRMAKYYDITFVYTEAHPQKLKEIEASVKCEKLRNITYQTDILLHASNWGNEIYNRVTSGTKISMIHADLSSYALLDIFRLVPNKEITHFVSVSEQARKSLKDLHNLDSTVIYNLLDNTLPIYPKAKNEKLKLITVSRLSPEKGMQRCIDFAKLIPFDYEWEVYGSGYMPPTSGTNIVYKGVTNKPAELIAKADYLVQLSDCEGYCYSIQESLQQKTPVLITPFHSGLEQVENKKNGYFIPFDLKNVNFDEIFNEIPILDDYQEKGSEQQWIDLFNKTYKKAFTMKIKIISPNVTNFKLGEIADVSEERAINAVAAGLAEYYTTKEKKEKK